MVGSNTFVKDAEVNLSAQENRVSLKQPDQMPNSLQDATCYTAQRAEKWHTLRSKFKVTGSTLHNALGLQSLREQQAHFDQTILGKKAPHFTPEVQTMGQRMRRMLWPLYMA